MKGEEEIDSHREEVKDVPRFFSLRSHRFVICLLLLIANYFGFANTMAMSTAVVCMVNSTLAVDKFNQSHNNYTCDLQKNEGSADSEFAIPGTMDWSSSEQSLLLSARFYGSCLSVAFSGAVADSFGADRVLSMVLALSAVITLLTPLFSSLHYHVALASRFVLGFIDSFHQPSINCLAAIWFPAEEKAIAASIYTAGYQFAGGFSSLFAAGLCKSSLLGGWPSIFYTFGTTCLLFLIIWIIFAYHGPTQNRWLKDNERKWLEKRVVLTSKAKKSRTPYSAILLSSPVHAVMLCHFAYSYATSLLQAYLPLFLRELGLSIDTIGWYTLTPFLAQIVGKAFVGLAVDYCSGKGIITLTNGTRIAQSMGSFGASIMLIFLSFLPNCDNPSISFYILLLFGILYSGGTCGFYTSMLTIAPDHMGTLSSIAAATRIAASVVATLIVNGLTAMASHLLRFIIETPLKWPLVFASAALFQSLAGLHFLIFGTTEVQKW